MTRCMLAIVIFGCVLASTVRSEEPAVESTSSRTIGDLTAMLGSSDKAGRIEAIDALGDRGKEAAEAVPVLLEQFDFEDPYIRESAAKALGAIGAQPEKVIPVLIEHFSDEGFVEKFDSGYDVIPLFAIYGTSVAAFGEPAIDPLIDTLGSDSRQMYLSAAIGLEAIGERSVKAMPQLIEMLEGSDTARHNAAAGVIRGIGSGAAEAVPALVKLLHAESFHTQYWVCRALGAIGPASATATEQLLDRLVNGTVSVRRNAAMALGNIGPDIGPEAVGKLTQIVHDEFTAPVREEAVIALGKLKPYAEESVPALKKALTDPDFRSPTHAARALWLLTGDPEEALPTLIKSMDDLTYFQHAVEVLGEMGPEAAPAVDRLIEGLSERDPDDRVAAAYALARIGSPAAKAQEPLREMLEDEEAQVREAAEMAIEAVLKAKSN
jgi:HEAT repeat protein